MKFLMLAFCGLSADARMTIEYARMAYRVKRG